MLDRIMGVITLQKEKYREIAGDATATGQAATVLIIALLIQGLFDGLVRSNPQTGALFSNTSDIIPAMILNTVRGLIGWVITAWILAFVAKLLGGKTNTGEMLRVTGYVEAFDFIAILNILGLAGQALLFIVGVISVIVSILRLVGYIIGVQEAAQFSTAKAIITAVIAWLVNLVIVVVIGGAVLISILPK